MGINVTLESEFGKEIASVLDPRNLLSRVVPAEDDPQFRWASTIDMYGNTVFNRRQSELLRKEWALLTENSADEETKALLRRIDELLCRCALGVHLYVKFYGD